VTRRRHLAAAIALLLALLLGAVRPVAAGTVPPPTPVGPSGSPSPFPTALHTPTDILALPPVSAPSASLEDLDRSQVLYSKASQQSRPVASLTKVMTALLVLDRLPLSATFAASARAIREPGAELGLRMGERMRVRDALTALLVASADDAAVALAERVSGSVEAFVELMNERALALGLRDSRFASPDGLDNAGHSTAGDLAKLARVAMAEPRFAEIVGAKRRTIHSLTGPLRVVQNRNVLLWLYAGTTGVKTGFTTPAGHCVIATAERAGVRLVAVVLGAPKDAFSDAAALLNHGFAAFVRTTVATAGMRLGTLTVAGRPIPVVVGATLVALVPPSARVVLRLRERRGVRASVRPGQRVGTLTASAAGVRIGSVPAVAGRGAVRRPTSRRMPPLRAVLNVVESFARSVFNGFL
jgi:D-alanyl-D-alanine carboxypeptidase (penicillin-binding protein 5/6)